MKLTVVLRCFILLVHMLKFSNADQEILETWEVLSKCDLGENTNKVVHDTYWKLILGD